MIKLNFTKLKQVKTPNQGTPGSAGIDFFVPFDRELNLVPPRGSAIIPSGIAVNIPAGYCLVAFNKSGIALNKNFQVGACVVDSDYQGEIHLHVFNVGQKWERIEPGMKLVQFLLLPAYEVVMNEVVEGNLFTEKTERGEGGFGSTNK